MPDDPRERFLDTVRSWNLATTCPEHGDAIAQFSSPLVTHGGPATSEVKYVCGCKRESTIYFAHDFGGLRRD